MKNSVKQQVINRDEYNVMAGHNEIEDVKPNVKKLDQIYTCAECPKKFTREAHLKRHSWSHKSEQPEFR